MKAGLHQAFIDGYLTIDIAAKVKNIYYEESQREYLTLEELNQLAATPCDSDILKRAALFSLTGLRHSDIKQLKWRDECKNAIITAREGLVKAETILLSNHRKMMLQQMQRQNEELHSFIKSARGVCLSPKVFWWLAGISYIASLYSLWNLLLLLLYWLR